MIPWSGRRAAVLALAPLAGLLAVAPAGPALANGDAVEIFRGREGPYEVIVGIQPVEPVVGTVHFSVTPLDASTSLPVTDAEITIVASDERGEPIYQARALNTPAAPRYYDANITFEAPGTWTLEVQVQSDGLGEATATVPLRVEEQSITPGPAGAFVLLTVVAALVGGSLYLWNSARRRRAAGR